MKIVDPACGSGAFLLAAFDYLVRWHEHYYSDNPTENARAHFQTAAGDRRLTADMKSTILSNNIFGVDIDPQAVEVTQMSLYLAVLAHENEASLQQRLIQTAHLPKLDKNIRCGNSLLGNADMPRNLFLAADEMQRRLNPFDWHSDTDGFGAVFSKRGGFDAVIGNPPYTRVQVMREVRPEETAIYQTKFRSATGSFDISALFVEQGLSFLRADGRLGYIISRQFTETTAGRSLRELLAEGGHVQSITDFADGLVFDATAYTLILIAGQKRASEYQLTRVGTPPSSTTLREAEADPDLSAHVPMSDLTQDGLLLPPERELLDRMRAAGPRLGELCGDVIFQGVITGGDPAFVLDPATAATLEPSVLRDVVRGASDIKRFGQGTPSAKLLFPYVRTKERAYRLMTAAELDALPNTRAWLNRHEALLRSRGGVWNDTNWWALSRPQNLGRWEGPKILVPYMTEHLCAKYEPHNRWFVNVTTGGYGIPTEGMERAEYVAALLNSGVLSWALGRVGRFFRGGYVGARRDSLVQLPIASADAAAEADVLLAHARCVAATTQLDDAVSDADKQRASRTRSAAISDFDEMVADLYGLTAEDRHLLRNFGSASYRPDSLSPESN